MIDMGRYGRKNKTEKIIIRCTSETKKLFQRKYYEMKIEKGLKNQEEFLKILLGGFKLSKID